MCEGVGENSRHGTLARIQCVFAISCALMWGVALVGEFHYWALLPVVGKYF